MASGSDSAGSARIEAAIRAVMPKSLKIHVTGDNTQADVRINGTAIHALWLPSGGLREAKAVLTRRPKPNVVVASQLSLGAREALANAGVGWLDGTGAAEIALGTLVVSRSGLRPQPPRRTSRWTPVVLAVAEALLCGSLATVEGVVRVTGLSAGACTYALRTLEEFGLVVSSARRGRASARRLSDLNILLDAYAVEAVAPTRAPALRVGVTWQEIIPGLGAAGRGWSKAGRPWAVTGVAAASLLAPYLSTITSAEVYLEARTLVELEAAALEVNLRPIDGGRLLLRPFPTVTTRRLAETRQGLRIAPWPRVYADLRATGVRGEEAAEHLREVLHG